MGNISALESVPLFTRPAFLDRAVPRDLWPESGKLHALSNGGFSWSRGSTQVCSVMPSGSGGCLTAFTRPAQIFLTGTQAPSGEFSDGRAEGLVPDVVKAVVIIMANGDRIPAPIVGNAFAVDVPAGVDIAGEDVTLRTGRTFYSDDRVSVPG